MSTTFSDIFEQLLNDRQVDVLVTGAAAESLRVSLVRKWNEHKRTYDRLGFLPEEMKNLSCSMEPIVIGDLIGSRFQLRFKANRAGYQIITTQANASTDNNE